MLGENFQDIDDEDDEEEFFEPEPLPVLGRCTALYTFQGQNQMFLLLDKIFEGINMFPGMQPFYCRFL